MPAPHSASSLAPVDTAVGGHAMDASSIEVLQFAILIATCIGLVLVLRP